jgi:hypothetical protein
MYSRWYTPAVILLWLSTMSWLVWQKVLPPMLVGDPPKQQEILAARTHELPVGWDISFNGRVLGWAVSTTQRLPNGGIVLRGVTHFNQLPVNEITPGWIQTLFKLAEQPATRVRLDARSSVELNRDGRPTRFRSVVQLPPLGDTIELEGQIEGTQINLVARSGEFSFTTQTHLPAGAAVGDALSPQTQLPGLHLGQTWTVPAFSPLRPPNSPVEILRATVERMVVFSWAGTTYDAWLVTYRSESGLSLLGGSRPAGQTWVRLDGLVLRQEVNLMDCKLTFTRMPADRALRQFRELPWPEADRATGLAAPSPPAKTP